MIIKLTDGFIGEKTISFLFLNKSIVNAVIGVNRKTDAIPARERTRRIPLNERNILMLFTVWLFMKNSNAEFDNAGKV